MEPWYDEILKLGKKYYIGKYIERVANKKGLFIGKHISYGVTRVVFPKGQ
jgi:hypothetical protein